MSTAGDTLASKLIRAVNSPAGRALIALFLVLVLGILFHADGTFFRFSTHSTALRQASVYGILACGMTLVIITGGIDLAVGSVLALGAVTFSLMSIHWGWSPLAAIPVCLGVGAACGGVSGALAARFKIQPFIATLAMMVFARGLAKMVSGQQKVATAKTLPDGETITYELPRIYELIDSKIFNNFLPVVTIIFLVCVVLSWILLTRHRWGRELFAIGGNEEAARLSGVPVAWAKTMAYVASGVLGAVAGICQAAQETHGDPDAGVAYELRAIAIVVIGGTNLMGGRGGIGLTLIGTLTFTYLDKILSINGIDLYGRLMLTGVIIIAAVLIQTRRRS
ncbi:MAG TPA: ABC transporter permease [Thermoguttaceae bacterium]|nr:ABC transporter permease [Thermoguttaceae bacterium]